MSVVGWRFSRRENVATWHVSRTLNLSRAKEPHPSREQSRFSRAYTQTYTHTARKHNFFFCPIWPCWTPAKSPKAGHTETEAAPINPGGGHVKTPIFTQKLVLPKLMLRLRASCWYGSKVGFHNHPFLLFYRVQRPWFAQKGWFLFFVYIWVCVFSILFICLDYTQLVLLPLKNKQNFFRSPGGRSPLGRFWRFFCAGGFLFFLLPVRGLRRLCDAPACSGRYTRFGF